MLSLPKATLSAGLLLAIVGCYSDRPHEYGQQRPPVRRRRAPGHSEGVHAGGSPTRPRRRAPPLVARIDFQIRVVVARIGS